ncbi:MAG TPA: malonyl-CoA decarboxylase family protein [Candidatus Acidoferrales bacterium]|nr:malonyl-CoA decarboxylase family protein [Candidatus Acidoferrales bacterium]
MATSSQAAVRWWWRYNFANMPGFLSNLLRLVRERRGTDMDFLCHHLLSERGEASQTVLAQEIIKSYKAMAPAERHNFFEMLCRNFGPDEAAIVRAAAAYKRMPDAANLAALSAAVEAPRQELLRRINTAARGTETLVAMRGHLLETAKNGTNFQALDLDLKHLFRSWFNRGFLRMERITWQTSALTLEKLMAYESVHEINGWPDLRRRLEADRRCFAFFHPALADEPIIFVEVALTKGLTANLEPLLDIHAPVLAPGQADTAIFYSISNCLKGLRGIAFGNFLLKQVVTELAAEFPNIKTYGTLSPVPNLSRALENRQDENGFTHERLSRLLADYAQPLSAASTRRDPVEAFLTMLKQPLAYREALTKPLERVSLAYLTQIQQNGKLYDPVATFHLSNGARLEHIHAFGNLRPYGLQASFGVTANYLYVPADLEENHERFVREGEIRVSHDLEREYKLVAEAWQGQSRKVKKASSSK